MTWQQVRSAFPDQWVLIEATQAHSEPLEPTTEAAQTDDAAGTTSTQTGITRRVITQMSVLNCFSGVVSGEVAWEEYAALHRKDPYRELYVLHTSNAVLNITERKWVGIRLGSS